MALLFITANFKAALRISSTLLIYVCTLETCVLTYVRTVLESLLTVRNAVRLAVYDAVIMTMKKK